MPRRKSSTVMEKAMASIKIPMTDAQMRKLAKGQGIRVNPSSSCTAYEVWCTPEKCRRMERMMTKGKGFALKFSPEEMDENVEIEGGRINFKKIGRTLRSTAKAAGKFYREKIRPVVGPEIRKAVETAIEKGIPMAATALGTVTGQPEIVAAATPALEQASKRIAKKSADKIAKLAGAFGMVKPKAMAKPKTKGGAIKVSEPLAKSISQMEFPKGVPYKPQLQDNFSPFLNPNHPGMNPRLPMPDNSLPIIAPRVHKGMGLYASSGRGLGSPMDPILPQIDNSTYIM